MTPERAEAILRGVLASIRLWADEAEALEAVRPGTALHLAASLKQAEQSLQQLIEREPVG